MNTATQPVPTEARKTYGSQRSRKKIKLYRTTVTLSPEALEIVERFKVASGISTSGAIEALILRSEPRKPRIKMMNGLAVFDVELEDGPLTVEKILELEDQPW